MFDIFDILVPELPSDSAFQIVQRQTAFGPSDRRDLYCQGVKLGEISAARVAYSNLEMWTGSPERADWIVVVTAPTARGCEHTGRHLGDVS